MSYLSANIRHLRKHDQLTQSALADRLGLKRSLIGAYEEGRAEPKLKTIKKMASLFHLTLDQLIDHDLSRGEAGRVDLEGRGIRILPIVTGPDEKERITVVPMKASAGYTTGFADPEYIESLPRFTLPLKEFYDDGTHRLFQITGDSMLPVKSGSYIISSYVTDWYSIKDDQCYIIITRDDGLVYKRVTNHLDQDYLLLSSDNPAYAPYQITTGDIAEVWKAEGYISFELPLPGEQSDIGELKDLMASLGDKLEQTRMMLDRP